jgi:hypothetical protein
VEFYYGMVGWSNKPRRRPSGWYGCLRNVKVTNEGKGKYTIAPNEVFRFGIIREIEFDLPIIVEGAVYGKRPFWRKGF